MKRILLHISAWFLIVIYLIVSLSFVSTKKEEVNCMGINIDIVDIDEAHFVTTKEITNLLDRNKFKYIGKPINAINTCVAESLLYKFPSIKQADAFISVDGYLNVRIEQRNPLVRIINKRNQSYYIDVKGFVMPLSENFSAYTLIVNGNIEEPFKIQRNQSVFIKDSTGTIKPNLLTDIFMLANYIANDDLWSSQIEQVYVTSEKEFVLIPRVGAHAILFGDMTRYEKKFDKLKAIYRVLNTVGWNKYKTINLKYKNQIICTKR